MLEAAIKATQQQLQVKVSIVREEKNHILHDLIIHTPECVLPKTITSSTIPPLLSVLLPASHISPPHVV